MNDFEELAPNVTFDLREGVAGSAWKWGDGWSGVWPTRERLYAVAGVSGGNWTLYKVLPTRARAIAYHRAMIKRETGATP